MHHERKASNNITHAIKQQNSYFNSENLESICSMVARTNGRSHNRDAQCYAACVMSPADFLAFSQRVNVYSWL